MRCEHPDRPQLAVRLSYGLNVYPSLDASGVLAGLREIALPLRARLAPGADDFGVGAWLPARAAFEFLADERRLGELLDLCCESGLDPCTFNAFPYGAFHGPGLKQRVFSPSWKERERLDYTLAVARIAARVRARRGGSRPGQHLSLSTHAGMFAAELGAHDREALADAFVGAARALAGLEEECGERVVLALEPEPRSSANDTRELAAFLGLVRAHARGPDERAVRRHLGACLDACHAAVEFEEPRAAFARATQDGMPLGKLQFSSALALRAPAGDERGRARLFALDEPVYLHQVTGRHGAELVRALDLGELAREWGRGAGPWEVCDEWRCHFHVPVDLECFGPGQGGLCTTRGEAARALAEALDHPERWGSHELHVEVETYTWNLLSSADTGAATLVDGLERELLHVLALLDAAGWRRAVPGVRR